MSDGCGMRALDGGMMDGELVEAVARLDAEIDPPPWCVAQFREEIGLGSWMRALVGDAGELAGYALARPQFEEWHLLKLGVAPTARRRGLGRRLVEGVIDAARRDGAGAVLLEVRASNAAALALYRGAGFAPVAIRKGYYRWRGKAEDAVLMSRRINGESTY